MFRLTDHWHQLTNFSKCKNSTKPEGKQTKKELQTYSIILFNVSKTTKKKPRRTRKAHRTSKAHRKRKARKHARHVGHVRNIGY